MRLRRRLLRDLRQVSQVAKGQRETVDRLEKTALGQLARTSGRASQGPPNIEGRCAGTLVHDVGDRRILTFEEAPLVAERPF